MQKSQDAGISIAGIRYAMLWGAISSGVLLILLLLCSLAADKFFTIFSYSKFAAKACLLMCALLCGIFSSRGGARKRIIYALAGELVLLIIVTMSALLCGANIFSFSWLIDVILTIFGAFAGTLLGHRRRRETKRRK